MRNKTNNELFSSVLYIVIGALLVIFRSQTLGWAMTVAGVVFVVAGVLDLIKKNWTSGAVSLIIGISILVLGWLAAKIVLLVLGILIAVKSIVALIDVFKKELKIYGSFVNPNSHQQAVDLINAGKIQTAPLITHRYPIEKLEEAIHMQMSAESIKVQIIPPMA